MTTIGLRRMDVDARGAALATGLAVWATAVFVSLIFSVRIPMIGGLLWSVPIGLTIAALLRANAGTGSRATLASLFAWAVALSIALSPTLAGSEPKYALAIPALAIAGILAGRFPKSAMVGVAVISGAYGTIDAYTGYHSTTFADACIAGLWVALIGSRINRSRRTKLDVSPGVILVATYVLITLVAVFAGDAINQGVQAFRLSTLHISVLLVIGLGAYTMRTIEEAARALTVVCLLVGAYATLRWAVGPSAKEAEATNASAFFTQYNQIGTGEDKVAGSLPNGQQLGVWMSAAIPFLLAVALGWRGKWQMVAVAALPFSLIGLLGSGQRTGFAAVIAGCLAIIVVHMLSRGFRGPRLGVALATVIGAIMAASFVYPAIVDTPEKRQRYANLLKPGEDAPFQERLTKWKEVLAELKGHPFGFGPGSGNTEALPRRFVDIATYNIDNSYLMIAYGQGIAVMIFFIVVLLVLLTELLRHAVWTRGPSGAAYATAAAGALVAMMVEMAGANHVDSPAMMAGWVIVGLGVAQYATRRSQAPDAD